MKKWRVELNETIDQSSVYIIDADSKEEADEIARNESGEMELVSSFTEDRKLNYISSVEPYKDGVT